MEANLKDVKAHGPDYKNVDKELAVKDFLKRIDHYKSVYETMEEATELAIELRFVKKL